ncbi:MAG: electron transfer flavoprotein subunit beta/FixA family protein [Magnetococcales bacterium]|nr:electron transfer flavoprotein subunit beta/FixA family protein [Magnetococcales bacterium]NGZ26988.1 electron transfer flavoprotein subunit beta/FixA family protein [Magnetococcales bacterium]
MKVLVAVKAVHDPAQPIWWQEDGPGWNRETPLVLNPFDAIALEEAVRWRQEGRVSQVVTITLGPPAWEEVLRSTLALGADQAVRVGWEDSTPLQRAKELAAWVVRLGVEVVLLGKQGVEEDLAQTGPMLAGLLGWPQATFVSRLVWQEEGSLLVWREVDDGLQQLLLPLPAIITVDLRLNTPRYASLPSILQAKRKPLMQEAALTSCPVDCQRLAIQPALLRPAKRVRLPSVEALAKLLRPWRQ